MGPSIILKNIKSYGHEKMVVEIDHEICYFVSVHIQQRSAVMTWNWNGYNTSSIV